MKSTKFLKAYQYVILPIYLYFFISNFSAYLTNYSSFYTSLSFSAAAMVKTTEFIYIAYSFFIIFLLIKFAEKSKRVYTINMIMMFTYPLVLVLNNMSEEVIYRELHGSTNIIFLSYLFIYIFFGLIFLPQIIYFKKRKYLFVNMPNSNLKSYSKTDENVPMAFYYFYIYARLPCSLIICILSWIQNGVVDDFWFMLKLLDQLTYVCACIGLVQKKYWGYVVNKVLLIANIVVSLCSIPFYLWVTHTGETFIGSFMIVNYFSVITVYSLIFIYFEKRKYLFEGAPQQGDYLQCPVCGFNNPADAFFCRCGYSFHTTLQAPKELNIRMFDKENGFFNKTETSDKVPKEYKNFIEPDGFLYAVGERQGNSIKYRFVEKKDWLNIINQNNSKPSETGHSPVYNDFEQTYNNIIKEISNLYKQDKKVFSKETLLSYKFEICTFMYFLTDFIMFKTNPSAREEICLKLSADIKNNICYQVEDFKHFFDMRIDLYGSIIRGEFEPANSLMLGNNSNDDTFMQLFRLLGDCIISSHYGYIPENDVISSLRVVDFVDIVFLNQILMMVNKQTEKYCKKIYI